ncbi:Uncharacterised protein [Neisseria meningitidis]|nr:Uncharacterised protein [Neisseria meningitidis]CWQ88426.1 Uncharacterised protein [Neisseria meningitidis]
MLLKNICYIITARKGAASGRLPGRQVSSLKKTDGKPVKMPSEAVSGRHFYGFAGFGGGLVEVRAVLPAAGGGQCAAVVERNDAGFAFVGHRIGGGLKGEVVGADFA